MVKRFMESQGVADKILNISHVYDLESYFKLLDTPKQHTSVATFFQPFEGKANANTPVGQSRASFRKGSVAPQSENPYNPSPHDIERERKSRMLSFEERLSEERKLEKHRKLLTKQDFENLKKDEKRLYQIYQVKEKIKQEQHKRYLGTSYISFKSLKWCVGFLRIFQSDFQKEALADANNKEYNYLMRIKARIAPFIDDLRWEAMQSSRRFYILEILFVLIVSSVNMIIEKKYNYDNLDQIIKHERSLGSGEVGWLIPLLLMLLLQVLLSVVAVVCLEKLISRYTFYKRSKKIEINFVFFNSFMILNNIMVVFYGFLWAASEISVGLDDSKKYRFNFYINFQWIKNSLIIIFVPLLQRLVGDYLIKWHFIPFLARKCAKKAKKETKPEVPEEEVDKMKSDIDAEEAPADDPRALQRPSEQSAAAAIDEATPTRDRRTSPVNDRILAGLDEENNPEDINSDESSEEQEEVRSENISEGRRQVKKKPIHDFGLNSSYIIQVAFFIGFYLAFVSPLLLFITFLGVYFNYKLEVKLLMSVYDKTKYLSIGNLFVSLRWAFVALCFGIIISVLNSELYMMIIKNNSEFDLLFRVSGFQNMIGLCIFAISWVYFIQMGTSRIMFRVLNTVEQLRSKYGGDFYRLDFEKKNYKSQNPFYDL